MEFTLPVSPPGSDLHQATRQKGRDREITICTLGDDQGAPYRRRLFDLFLCER